MPVDANALVSASLPVELTDQVQRAQQELAALHPSAGTWVAQGPLSQTTLAQLEHLGFTHVVLPASAVVQSGSQTLTATRIFTLPQGKGLPPLAGQADSALGTHLAAADEPIRPWPPTNSWPTWPWSISNSQTCRRPTRRDSRATGGMDG